MRNSRFQKFILVLLYITCEVRCDWFWYANQTCASCSYCYSVYSFMSYASDQECGLYTYLSDLWGAIERHYNHTCILLSSRVIFKFGVPHTLLVLQTAAYCRDTNNNIYPCSRSTNTCRVDGVKLN
ncbi:uncharacterized protein K452DRAFT_126402 [Aplosporella prunicola CBS 121167]|uniref:Secreted protein n=1 Tax=Aplosporella prunicola CBS 121167 TaxID=1176127 RepID=A0A6A6AY59_9PEZI|nr:uncharacterized protein K452DRAFT_126402 [Aplosporella prunicola CBS 121167]KAF2136710.1 hypothetical protein K452DRAFT_126402 [Aplosporella prunicola CBS 121167]